MRARKTTRGGARTGAGRPAAGAAGATRRVNVTLDDQTLDILRGVGGGNVSEGIRILAARVNTASRP